MQGNLADASGKCQDRTAPMRVDKTARTIFGTRVVQCPQAVVSGRGSTRDNIEEHRPRTCDLKSEHRPEALNSECTLLGRGRKYAL
jgi:hypothetical protein